MVSEPKNGWNWVLGSHVFFMSLGIFLVSSSISIALYQRSRWKEKWFDYHLNLQLAALLSFMTGVFFLLFNLESHFNYVKRLNFYIFIFERIYIF